MIISAESLSDRIFSFVKGEVLSGRVKGGERISEEMLSNIFSCSSSPVREAMVKLQEYGLITIYPRRYAEVIKFSDSETKDFNDIRYMLEKHALESIDEGKLERNKDEINDALSECDSCLRRFDREKAFRSDARLHISLVKASENKELINLYLHFEAKIQILRITQFVSTENTMHYMRQHKAIWDLLRSGRKEETYPLLLDHISHTEPYTS